MDTAPQGRSCLAPPLRTRLGHLLISKEHSKTGIMKAYLNQSDFRKARQGELRLTAEQARNIRNSSARVAPGEHVAENLLSTDCRSARANEPSSRQRSRQDNRPLESSPFVEGAPRPMLSPAVLAEARQTLTQIYHAAGIGVQWKTNGADFTVFVISRPPPSVRVSSFALGYPTTWLTGNRPAAVLQDSSTTSSVARGIRSAALTNRTRNVHAWIASQATDIRTKGTRRSDADQ